MEWTKTPPTEPGQYKIRRTLWGGKVWADVVEVYEDEGLWVVEHGLPGTPDINQPMDEWLEQQPPIRWLGPLENNEEKLGGFEMTVADLINKLSQLDQTLSVYITACKTDKNGMACGEARLEFPNPVLSRMDPEQEAELPEEARLGEFVLLEPEDA